MSEEPESEEKDRIARLHIRMTLAAGIAEERAGYIPDADGMEPDNRTAVDLAGWFCCGEIQAVIDAENEQAREFVRVRWDAISVVARELERGSTLSMRDVRSLMPRTPA
jgi:hypothetical protein